MSVPTTYTTAPGVCPDCGGNRQPRKPRCNRCQMAIRNGEPITPYIPEPTSGYVCRAHLDQSVTWRGTGCQTCQQERAR